MKYAMKLTVAVEVQFTVQTEDGDESYEIVAIKPPPAAAFRRALSADDAAVDIEAEISTRRARRRGLVA